MEKFYFLRKVRSYEVDAFGFLHSSNYFRYMEECECAFFRNIGLSFFKDESNVVFPRVSTSLNILSPTPYGDNLEIVPSVEKIGKSSIEFVFNFFEVGVDGEQTLVAKGGFNIVSCAYDENESKLKAVSLEKSMKDKLLDYKENSVIC